MTFWERMQWLPYDAIVAIFGAGLIAGILWGSLVRSGLTELVGKLWR